MGRNLRARLPGIISLAILLAAGCGKSESQPKTAHVHGKVYHQGTPLQGGTLAFVPDAELGGRGEIATVEIGADGSYAVETAPGWHRVTVKGPPSSGVPSRYSDPELCQVRPLELKAGTGNFHDIRLD